MENYESEYQTPVNSVVDRYIEGDKVVTVVFMDGEFHEFEASFQLRAEGLILEDNGFSKEDR